MQGAALPASAFSRPANSSEPHSSVGQRAHALTLRVTAALVNRPSSQNARDGGSLRFYSRKEREGHTLAEDLGGTLVPKGRLAKQCQRAVLWSSAQAPEGTMWFSKLRV